MAKKMTKKEEFQTYVGNIGSHCACLHTDSGKLGMSAVAEMPMVRFFIEQKGETPDVWDMCYQVHEDGTRETLGNRCAAVSRYTQIASEYLHKFVGGA